MKKIGILTINDYNNYGNRLQNYATQEYLKSLGFMTETIVNKTIYSVDAKKPSFNSKIRNLCKLPFNQAIRKIANKIYMILNRKKINKVIELKLQNFINFTEEYIHETDYSITDISIPENLSKRYDYFVTGSDQVWNPNNHRTSSIDFLTFADNHQRIALAPSFGVSVINQSHLLKFKQWLNGMTYLSVREHDGARIIKELTDRDVPVLIDPTLLFDKDKWLSISKKAKYKPSQPYLLTYFLGEISKKHQKQINKFCKKYNLELVKLGDLKELETYSIGPSEFIDYINSCSVLCTDSFHGAIFSILLKKPFVIYDRVGGSVSMHSRINTLLNKFNLNSRMAENFNEDSDIFNIDYTHVQPILEAERKKFFDYLKNALNLEENINHEN